MSSLDEWLLTRLDNGSNGEDGSAAKQNEQLKAVAKQVISN